MVDLVSDRPIGLRRCRRAMAVRSISPSGRLFQHYPAVAVQCGRRPAAISLTHRRDMVWSSLNPGRSKWHHRRTWRKLKLDDFEPHLDAVFEMTSPGGHGAAEARKDRTLRAGDPRGRSFSLLFVAPAGPSLPQAIYPVRHPALGTMEIFLVPVGPVSGRQRLSRGVHLRRRCAVSPCGGPAHQIVDALVFLGRRIRAAGKAASPD